LAIPINFKPIGGGPTGAAGIGGITGANGTAVGFDATRGGAILTAKANGFLFDSASSGIASSLPNRTLCGVGGGPDCVADSGAAVADELDVPGGPSACLKN
jgi:hypothetical protein